MRLAERVWGRQLSFQIPFLLQEHFQSVPHSQGRLRALPLGRPARPVSPSSLLGPCMGEVYSTIQACTIRIVFVLYIPYMKPCCARLSNPILRRTAPSSLLLAVFVPMDPSKQAKGEMSDLSENQNIYA